VAAPFLGSLGGRSARAESADPPKRLIAMFTHGGCLTTRFFPKKSHGELTREDLEPTTLVHLAPYVDKILMPRGMRAMNEWTTDLSRGQGNDPHLQVVGSYFTCQPVTPNGDDPFSFDRETKFNAKPIGRSLDHVIAEQLSPDRTPFVLRIGNRQDSPATGISYSAAETPYPGLGDVSQIYSSLTGLFVDGPLSADSYAAVKGKSIIDLVRDDLDTLERFDMGQSDRLKLEAWKQLLDETGRVMSSPECRTEIATVMGVTQETIDAVATAPDITARINDSLDVSDLYSSFAVLAAVCNVSPVIVLKYPAVYTFSGLGLTLESHGIAHRTGNANMSGACLEGVLEMIHTIDDYHARKFAYLVRLLASINEGEGRVLDNAAAVWFQEMSDGSAHNLNNLPIVQAGSAGGYFKTGHAINVEDGSPDLPVGNSEATCADGTPDQADALSQVTGTDPSLANAPINKYFCTLMNALGVKAGADGFPLLGGSAEVTHFGLYDRTEDFAGGGVVPAAIHDPGEFTALKANT
jgi:hypothetical protein